MSISPHEDQFLEEVFGLFALEAQEWMTQCKAALLELEAQPPENRQAKFYETILCGITNLGGSAATVELPALEKLAFALVPLLHTMQALGPRSPGEQLAALREGLDEITLGIEHLEETKNGTVPGLDRVLQRLTDALSLPGMDSAARETNLLPYPDAHQRAVTALSPVALWEALRGLERNRSDSTQPTRHLAEAIFKRATDEQNDGQNGSHVEVSTIVQILHDLETRDEQFIQDLHQRLPTIEGLLSELMAHQSDTLDSNPAIAQVLQEIRLLHDAARALDAKTIMGFFHGLQTFLGILSRKGVLVLPQRIDAVLSRLRSILPLAEQWVEVGKQDRTSIQKLVNP
jgi:chemotaxis protein histidine kinase CheA